MVSRCWCPCARGKEDGRVHPGRGDVDLEIADARAVQRRKKERGGLSKFQ